MSTDCARVIMSKVPRGPAEFYLRPSSTSGRRTLRRHARPCAAPLLRRLGVPAWMGEAEDPVLRHACGPRRLLDVGRWPGAVVRLGLGFPSARAAGAVLVWRLCRATGRAVYRDPL